MALLPGGADSLLAMLERNPNAVVENWGGPTSHIRLVGRGVEGTSYYRCVWEAVRDRAPATIFEATKATPRNEWLAAIDRARRNH